VWSEYIRVSLNHALTDNSVYTRSPTDALMPKCVYPIPFIKYMLRPLSRSATGQYIYPVYYPPFVVPALCQMSTIPPTMCVQQISNSNLNFPFCYGPARLKQMSFQTLLGTMVSHLLASLRFGFCPNNTLEGFRLRLCVNVNCLYRQY
jgi:hypothetical protein